jgi:glycopeptide antibiotics resistance protein
MVIAALKRFSVAGLIFSLTAALAVEFPWSDWVGHAHWAKVGWIPFYSWPVSLSDIVQNIILFVPAGVCARLAFGARARIRAPLLSLPVSLLGEWTQLYSHNRFPSATDVVCNIVGSLVGVWLAERLLRLRESASPVRR